MKLQELKKICAEIYYLKTTAAVLEWDQQVNMPRAGSEGRAAQMSLLSGKAHEIFVSDRVGALLEDLKPFYAGLSHDSDDYCLLRQLYRDYEREKKIPLEYVNEFSMTTGIAFGKWEEAKNTDNFALFKPYLEKIFNLRRQYAGFFAPCEHIYDPLLNDFEPGTRTVEVLSVFKVLRDAQVALIREITSRHLPDDTILKQYCPENGQWKLCRNVASLIGFDWNRGRLDSAEHPFTTTFNLNDVRITTHIYEKNLMSAIFSTMHEGGHAIYEQGVDRALDYSPLGTGASLAIHESQSRLWENLVGRSKDFLNYFYPEIQRQFPGQFGNIKLNDFYRAVNKVEPSLIRIEADEATYNLHVMLRMELEIAVLEEKITVSDLPAAWREKIHEYLGVVPQSDAEGVLQDVHWAGGMIGYFPTYTLGNIISAQIWEKAMEELPGLGKQISQGNLISLREWLTEKLYRHGAKFYPAELIKMVTGNNLDPQPYLRYLQNKYQV